MTPADGALLEVLHRIADDLSAIRQAVERPSPSAPLRDAIAAAVGPRAFNTRELCKHAARPISTRFRAEILAECGSLNPRKLTPVLRRLEGHGLERVGVASSGACEIPRLEVAQPIFLRSVCVPTSAHHSMTGRTTWND